VPLLLACGAHALAGNVDARWLAPVSGDWTDPPRWSSSPFYPDNGNPAESVYHVLLDVPGPDYTVTLNAPVPVDVGSTLISSPVATLAHAGGTFNVGSLAVGQGGVGRHRMTGGTLNVNNLTIGAATLAGTGSGTFEQFGGRVFNVDQETFIGVGTGTLLVSGNQSQYTVVPPGSSSPQIHYIGLGTMSRGIAHFANNASVTLARADVGVAAGAGTILIDSFARVFINSLYLGWSNTGTGNGIRGDGTLILSSGRLTFGPQNVRIGSEAGSGNLLVNNGTLTIQPQSPVDGFFTIGRTGRFTVIGNGVVESQRSVSVSAGRIDVTGGTVTFPLIRLTTSDPFLTGGTLALTGGRLNANEISITSGNFVQTGGAAVLGGVQLSLFEGYSVPPTGRLDGGTFNASGLSISSGTFTYQGGILDVLALSIRTSGRFIATPGRDKTLRVGSLLITGQGRLDLGDNFMLLDSGAAPAVANIRALLRAGHNNGAWDGPGIMSAVAQTTPGYGIGSVQPSPLFTPLLVAYTRYGDADVDGAVDLSDFNALAAHFGSADAFWSDGDFNYDGRVDLIDFNRLAANFGLSAAGPHVTPQDWARLGAAVPEPASFALLGAVAGPALSRRRRR
jgi:hypothetical protein